MTALETGSRALNDDWKIVTRAVMDHSFPSDCVDLRIIFPMLSISCAFEFAAA